MREPISIRSYPDFRAEMFGARQTIFDCGNGYGLSVISVEKGSHWDHGWYCDAGQYEAYLITIEDGDWDYVYEPGMPRSVANIRKGVEPFGWLTIEKLGELIEVVEEGGAEAYITKRGL